MGANILRTGAAGYIAGPLVADLLASEESSLQQARIKDAGRSQDQAAALLRLGIDVFQLDRSDEKAVAETVVQNDTTSWAWYDVALGTG